MTKFQKIALCLLSLGLGSAALASTATVDITKMPQDVQDFLSGKSAKINGGFLNYRCVAYYTCNDGHQIACFSSGHWACKADAKDGKAWCHGRDLTAGTNASIECN